MDGNNEIYFVWMEIMNLFQGIGYAEIRVLLHNRMRWK